jgi:type IV secretory pathway VirB3-like protein
VNSKNRLQNLFRGWLPKDQPFQTGATASKKTTLNAQSPENSENPDKPLTKGQTKALAVLGIVNLIMLISTSSYLVIYLITPSIWTSTLGLGLWVLFASVMLSANYVLYRNYRKQTKLAETA